MKRLKVFHWNRHPLWLPVVQVLAGKKAAEAAPAPKPLLRWIGLAGTVALAAAVGYLLLSTLRREPATEPTAVRTNYRQLTSQPGTEQQPSLSPGEHTFSIRKKDPYYLRWRVFIRFASG